MKNLAIICFVCTIINLLYLGYVYSQIELTQEQYNAIIRDQGSQKGKWVVAIKQSTGGYYIVNSSSPDQKSCLEEAAKVKGICLKIIN